MPVEPAILIPAAGSSRRLGRPKQLLRHGDIALITHAARAALQLSSHVYIVLGHEQVRCRIALHDLPVTPLFNPRFHDGIGSSIASGVSQIPPQTHLLIMLCDQPLIPMTHFRALIRAATEQPEKIIASHYHGRPGVPAIFPALYHSALMQLTGDRGAKGLLDSPACLELPLSHADALDVDTAEAWATVLRERGLFAGAQRSMD